MAIPRKWCPPLVAWHTPKAQIWSICKTFVEHNGFLPSCGEGPEVSHEERTLGYQLRRYTSPATYTYDKDIAKWVKGQVVSARSDAGTWVDTLDKFLREERRIPVVSPRCSPTERRLAQRLSAYTQPHRPNTTVAIELDAVIAKHQLKRVGRFWVHPLNPSNHPISTPPPSEDANMASRIFHINWDKVHRFLPEAIPPMYKAETDGLLDANALTSAGTGADGKAVRLWIASMLHAALRRVEELETQAAKMIPPAEAVKLGGEPVDNGAALPLFRDAALAMLQCFGGMNLSQASSDLELASALQAKASTFLNAVGDAAHGDDYQHTILEPKIQQLEADLKKANTRAKAYYTSWQSLERRTKGKPKQVPSDEMNLTNAITALVEKGYILDVETKGQIPIEIMCSKVASIAEKLPPVGAVEAKDTPSLPEPMVQVNQIEHIYSVGDPYPVETRVKNPDGKVHIYVRQDGESKKMVPAADVSNYEELEQINASLDSQLRAAQKELSEAACWMDTARQHAKNEEFYRDLLDQTAVALQNPDVYKSDDGSIQQDPVRLKIPELVAKLHAMGCENLSLLAHQTALLDKFRSGVRAVTDPMEGQDDKLLEMLTMLKGRVLFTGNGTHFLAQSMEMRNRALYRITGLYYNGHDCEPVDFVDVNYVDGLPADAQPEEPKAQAVPNVIDMAFQGLLDRITDAEQQGPLEDCHTGTAGPLHLRAEFFDGVVVERRWDGFDFTVLTIPQAITPKQELGNHMMGCEYMVETNTLYLLAAWKGEHPSNWKLDATFDIRPQIINRQR